MPLRLATLAVLMFMATACGTCAPKPPAPPPGPPATIELQPGVLLIGGKRFLASTVGGSHFGSELHRQAMKEALRLEPDRLPLIIVTPSVGYDALFDAFELTFRAYGELHDLSWTDAVRVRLRCSANERAWDVSPPSFGAATFGRESADHPPDLWFTVAVGSRGFYLAAAGGVLPRTTDENPGTGPPGEPEPDGGEGRPTIPRVNGALDFAALRERVALVKKAFPGETRLILASDGKDVRAGDVCRILEAVVPYFPEVVLGSF